MAARIEDLLGHDRAGRGTARSDAIVYKFPTEQVRRAAAYERARARRRHRAQIRRHRAGLALVALGTVVVSIFATGPDGSAPASTPGAPRAVVVQPGQTLWGVAERYAPDGIDPRAYVDALSRLNELDGALMAGARIRLP